MIGWRRISDTLRAERTSHSIMPGNENNARPKKSAYLSLYEKIREGILTGDYPYGSRLPSKRTLAADAGVSVITASHALLLLAEEGYIEGRERSGSFVIYEGAGQSAAPEKDPERKDPGASGTIHAADIPSSDDTPVSTDSAVTLSPTDFLPFSLYARTIRRVLSDRGEDILKRGPNQGVPELRGAISRYLARNRGIHVLPEQILIGSGAEYLYGLIVQMLGRDTVFGLEDPSYEKIRLVYEANGAKCVLLPMGKHGIRSEALKATDAGALHLTPFRSYPSGITAGASKRREYIEWAKKRDAVLVEDDVDSEFSVSGKPVDTLFSLSPERHVLYLKTFTHTIAPSMRCGYLLLPSGRYREYIEKIRFYSCTVPVFDQYVLAEFIESGEFERHLSRVRRMLRKK